MRTFTLLLLVACGGPSSSSGDDMAVPDAPDGDGPTMTLDGSTDLCLAQQTGALVQAEAIAVPGEVSAIAVDAVGVRTLVGRYTTEIALPDLGFGSLSAPASIGYDGFAFSPGQWVTVAAGDGTENITAVANDSSGSIYIAGTTTSSTMTLGPLEITNPGGRAYINFVAKLRASDGMPLWIQRLVGPTPQPSSYAFTNCGGLAISGARVALSCVYGNGSLSFVGAGGITYSEAVQGRSSTVVLGLDPATGEAAWQTTAGNLTTNANTAANVQPAPNGNFYLSGTFTQGTLRIRSSTAQERGANNISTGSNGFVAELEGGSGDPTSSRAFGDTTAVANDGPSYVTAEARGSTLFLAVLSSSGIGFDGHTATGSGAFVAALPLASWPYAVPTWLRGFTDPSGGSAFTPQLAVDECGRASLAVATVFDTSFGSVDITANTAGVVKLDAAGEPQWYSGFTPCNGVPSCDPRSALADLRIAPMGTTLLVGKFGGLVDFGAGQVGLGLASQPFVVEYAP